MSYKKYIKIHQMALRASADSATKEWWENYMKGAISFYGVGIPKNREILKKLRKQENLHQWPPEREFELALAFFAESVAENKLAGILYIQNFLLKKIPWERQLTAYEEIFANGWIFDWNTCDWFCVRVLGPLIQENGRACALRVSSWSKTKNLWQARSSLVPFIKVASDATYYPLIKKAAKDLICREERFAKTAVGWILRDISKYNEDFALDFIEKKENNFTKEILKNSLKCFPKEVQEDFLP